MAMKRTVEFSILWMVMICPQVLAAVTPTEDYFGSMSLVNNDVYQLFWKSDDTSITFEVHAKVKGWIGFGLSPNGGMARSDIVIGWVKDGIPYFQDRFAEKQGVMPTIDVSQDWTLLAAEETSTHTMLKFKRSLYTCDSEDRHITADTTRVIFAYSDIDPKTEEAVVYHEGNRGTKSLLLIGSHDVPASMPSDAFYKDFLNTNVSLPGNVDTTYWCQKFRPPNITKKHHLIRLEPIIQPGNEAFVHHIVLYACYHTPKDIEQVDEGALCNVIPGADCQTTIGAWAVGGVPFNFPENVGFPFGDSGGITLVRLETHYDNSQLTKGVIDSSGLRMWFTPSLRTHDAGTLTTGMPPSPYTLILPADYTSLTFQGHCTKECLSEGMGEVPEINVFGVMLHTHLLGIGVRVHHYRDGVEKAYISSDLAYDFNYQETRSIFPEITVRKGDNIMVECIYDTKGKENATFGGLATTQEMCTTYLYYYPQVDIILCMSQPTQANMAKHLGLKFEGGHRYAPGNITEGPYRGKGIEQYIREIGKFSDQVMMDKYQEAVKTGEIFEACQLSTGFSTRTTQVPKVVSVYQKDEDEAAHQCSGAFTNRAPSEMMWMMLSFCGLLILAKL